MSQLELAFKSHRECKHRIVIKTNYDVTVLGGEKNEKCDDRTGQGLKKKNAKSSSPIVGNQYLELENQ